MRYLLSIVPIFLTITLTCTVKIYSIDYLAVPGINENKDNLSTELKNDLFYTYLRGEELAKNIELLSTDIYTGESEQLKICKNIIESGCAIFDSYTPYLGAEGLELKNKFYSFYAEVEKNNYFLTNEQFLHLKNLSKKIPTVKEPNEDLFIDVLQGLSGDQLDALANSGYLNQFNLLLSDKCPNQCLFCMVSCISGKGKNTHMPFPLVVKILKKMVHYQKIKSVIFYLNSEITNYSDRVIDATIENVVEKSTQIGFYHYSSNVHGVPGKRAENTKNMLRGFDNIVISFTVYHEDVFRYIYDRAQNKIRQGSEIDVMKRERIIDRNIKRFVPLITGAIESNQKYKISYLKFQPNTLHFLSPYSREVIYAMEGLQQEAARRLAEVIFQKTGKTITFSPAYIIWGGKSITLLRRLGESEEDIIKVKQHERETYNIGADPTNYDSDYMLSVMPDGSISLWLKKGGLATDFNKLNDMFISYRSDKFKNYMQILKIVLDANFISGDKTIETACVKTALLDKDSKQFIIDTLKKDQPWANVEEILANMEEIYFYLTNNSSNRSFQHQVHYFRILFNFLLSKDSIRPLLANLTDGNLEKLYYILKDIYLPNRIMFFGKNISRPLMLNFKNADMSRVFDEAFHKVRLQEIKAFEKSQ